MSVVSFCCFYIPLNKTAHGRAYWNALHTAGSVYAGSLPVPSTNLSSGQVKARTKKAYAIYGDGNGHLTRLKEAEKLHECSCE